MEIFIIICAIIIIFSVFLIGREYLRRKHVKKDKAQPKKIGFWEKAKEEAERQQREKIDGKQALKERIKQMDRDGIAYCPKCYSTSLTANKKGFGIGKAVIGATLTGKIGLTAGNIGAKKVRVTCLKCGHQFWAGKKK